MIKVMVVDDSALVRQTMQTILPEKEGFIVVTASNPLFADKKLATFTPDVLILDLQMPQMDGITYLKKIMSTNPLPIIICSSYTNMNSDNAIKALDLGAVEIIEKPKLGSKEFLEESKTRIQDIVRAALNVKLKKTIPREKTVSYSPKLTADVILSLGTPSSASGMRDKVIVIGASTGGTEALRDFLSGIPGNLPPILIVQHMPKYFTKAFAERLDTISRAKVLEAENGMKARVGEVYIAPGDEHMILKT